MITYNEMIKKQVSNKLDTIKVLSGKKQMLKSVIASIKIQDSHLLKSVIASYTDTVERIKTVTTELTPLLQRGGYFKII